MKKILLISLLSFVSVYTLLSCPSITGIDATPTTNEIDGETEVKVNVDNSTLDNGDKDIERWVYMTLGVKDEGSDDGTAELISLPVPPEDGSGGGAEPFQTLYEPYLAGDKETFVEASEFELEKGPNTIYTVDISEGAPREELSFVEVESVSGEGKTSTISSGLGDNETIYVCLDDSITFHAVSNPVGPSDSNRFSEIEGVYPDWTITGAGASITSGGDDDEDCEVTFETVSSSSTDYKMITVQCGSNDTDQRSLRVIVFEVESETIATTPTDRERTTIGVCEEVELIVKPSGLTVAWSLIPSDKGGISSTSGDTTTLTARLTEGSTTVRATVDNNDCDTVYEVIKPTGMGMTKESEITTYGAVFAAAGMEIKFCLQPDTVSFYNIITFELNSPLTNPASNITGEVFTCTSVDSSDFDHDPGNNAFSYGFDNISINLDTAEFKWGGIQPLGDDCGTGVYQAGSFDYIIPNKYLKKGSSDAKNGIFIMNITQSHNLEAVTGKVTVTKGGSPSASVTRYP